ncbi:MAG: alpha/beta hydrolase fold domain-containing protein, partial [Acidobacteriota bacterium]|nr:alpha/beta hydrolase fold domain-containing protein [Acidobacteriota bacterium]
MSAGQRAQWAARRSGLPSGGTRRWRAILEAGAVRTLAALPQGLTARLAGAPTMIDGQRLDPEVQLALGLLALASEQPLETLSPAQARAQVSRDASLFQGPPIPLRATEELTIPAGHGPIPARLHVPEPAPGEGGLLVYFHGGGFVVGDLDSHDNTCRFLASQAGVRVLSVHYRRAPEHPFPAAAEDALTAFLFACGEAHVLGAEAGRIAVGGDSAGGNLAAVVAQQARTGDTPP